MGSAAGRNVRFAAAHGGCSGARYRPGMVSAGVSWTDELRGRLDELLDGYRVSLHDSLEGSPRSRCGGVW